MPETAKGKIPHAKPIGQKERSIYFEPTSLIQLIWKPPTIALISTAHRWPRTVRSGLPWGDRGLGRVLIPIRHAAHFVAQMVAVPDFDGDANFLLEAHRVLQVEDVAGLVASGIVGHGE